ncbi:MAG: helix-hairpin-helix domain-containing protein, partial [Candidatus Latescibacteria bacterium]|nr:helix-hairpin-helix domain-containing protein [Candidatus Latescibacterota bacterium]
RPADAWLLDVVRRAWRVKISIHLEVELLMRLREAAEEVAIEVFAANLKDLLMAAPAGSRATMGLDPGLRTGVKVAVVDATGKRVAHTTVYPHPPRKQWDVSIRTLSELIQEHEVTLISIGNGTASRETDKLGADLMAQHPEWGLTKVMVSEAGASVYSASATAAQEFPDLDVVFRGAVSIARRLQDPLAELVKIEPKSIGVGQYQHDVRQSHLARSLDTVVEDCVNAVGVAVNTASIPLLAHVSGLNEGLARNIVAHRDQHGPFLNRQGLKSVPRLGLKTFEQSAGFLRIPDGDHPLDASAVHPEAYPVVKRILTDVRKDIRDVIGDRTFLKGLDPERYSDATFGLPTVVDIICELEKPGRDPRPEFHTAQFKEGVETLQDLREGMILEGVVTNVTHFGAFVDIGVHQDGLAHISELANRFVKDPRDVVKTGGIVRVRVLKVDPVRRRIALSMRLNEGAE